MMLRNPRSDRRLRVAFFVQGEGRGHLTQALAAAESLQDAGHEVAAVFVGEDPTRPLPEFFRDGIDAPLLTYPFPAFLTDADRRGVLVGRSVVHHLRRFGRYWSQGPRVDAAVRGARPHLLINFHDLMGGLYHFLYRPGVEMLSVAHHFLMAHPEAPELPGRRADLALARLYSVATSFSARLRIALSFRRLRDVPERGLVVAPPLLRREVLQLPPAPPRATHRNGARPCLLAYVLNSGYAEDLRRWKVRRPAGELHCFWDRADVPARLQDGAPGLVFHRLDGREFLALMRRCDGYAGTAGFESICEAAYLGKPVLVVPTEGHVEQAFNARDAQEAGVARAGTRFDLDPLLETPPPDPARLEAFRAWVRSGPEVFVRLVETIARGPRGLPRGRGGPE